jgi:hypothetical protein
MKRIISASLIAATLSIFFANTNPLFAQGTDRYQRFKGTTSGGGECDYHFNDLLKDPDSWVRETIYAFDEGFVYKGLFDGESAEVLIVRNDNVGVCRYFRTPTAVHKIRLGRSLKERGKYFLTLNGKEVKLLSGYKDNYDADKPVSFIDSKGIKHTIVIYKERIPNP